MSKIQDDFDLIALLSEDSWEHNNHYHRFLLKQVPSHCVYALDIGCGTGEFTRLLADRSNQVLALDLSPNMIQIAREKSNGYTNIEYQIIDITKWYFPAEQFDCIASITTMHHLPMEEMLHKIKRALKLNGILIILDISQGDRLRDVLTSILAVPINLMLNLIKNRHLRQPRILREAWAQHGKNDSYLKFSQIQRICSSIIPGCIVRKHLLWRYSITWKKQS